MDKPAADNGEKYTGELLELLELETLEENHFQAREPRYLNLEESVFGGLLVAQALRAATLTIPIGRLPHSLHGYFLRPGRIDIPILLEVERDRDGRAMSARRVTITQNGQAIFRLSASFQIAGGRTGLQVPLPEDVVMPDNLNSTHWTAPDPIRMFEIRNVTRRPDGDPSGVSNIYWARTRGKLSDDPLLHSCLLAYFSDAGTGLTELPPRFNVGGPSLDHAMWFHRHIRMDEWVLFAMKPVSAAHNRGLYWGTLHSQSGNSRGDHGPREPLPRIVTCPWERSVPLAVSEASLATIWRPPPQIANVVVGARITRVKSMFDP